MEGRWSPGRKAPRESPSFTLSLICSCKGKGLCTSVMISNDIANLRLEPAWYSFGTFWVCDRSDDFDASSTQPWFRRISWKHRQDRSPECRSRFPPAETAAGWRHPSFLYTPIPERALDLPSVCEASA